ncbi:uncharacterized protein LOC105447351 isoform X2 [Strongylocentrotus purpuratus]|uniref:MACPF domain-containing protein n=1 Tax=Strongylocentrotus purpuratus TaxID=7668 RepID=A0A7M7HQ83_STRPU|nr:uncharacterized protein LOC105447351 isoform X2 [Strongylocentrotus purpuratus]
MKFDGVKNAPILLLMVTTIAVDRCSAQLPTPSAINFIGIGYNILEGNPEGGELGSGGVDPGLLVSRRILELSYDNAKLSSDSQYRVPDEVYFVPRSSAYTSSSRTTFHGTQSYASKLSAQVDVSGSYSSVFTNVEFAASARYETISNRMSSQGSVFFATQTIRNLGNARYLTELARPNGYALNNGFISDACSLPNSYNEAAYMQFLNAWGTHIVIEVDLGTREGTNYEESRSSFVEYASTQVSASLSAAGSYAGYSASIAVNMDSFNSGMESGTSFGSTYSSYTVGSSELNEPIKLELIGLHEVFDEKYWTLLSTYIGSGHCTSSFQRSSVGSNVLTAMQNYANYASIAERTGDGQVLIPLTWPDGTYGLPKPTSGCPNSEFTWPEGYRHHDTEDDNSNNQWSNPLNLAGSFSRNNMRHHFCMKTTSVVDSNLQWSWQPGSYCIYKYNSCPAGQRNDSNEELVSLGQRR